MDRAKAGCAYIGVTVWVTLIEVDAIRRWVSDEPVWLTKPGVVLLGFIAVVLYAAAIPLLRRAFGDDEEGY